MEDAYSSCFENSTERKDVLDFGPHETNNNELFPACVLQLMSDSSEFIVIGIIGPPGVGKSTILNELYGYDGSTTGELPPCWLEVLDLHFKNVLLRLVPHLMKISAVLTCDE